MRPALEQTAHPGGAQFDVPLGISRADRWRRGVDEAWSRVLLGCAGSRPLDGHWQGRQRSTVDRCCSAVEAWTTEWFREARTAGKHVSDASGRERRERNVS